MNITPHFISYIPLYIDRIAYLFKSASMIIDDSMRNSQKHRFQGIFTTRKSYASKSFNAKSTQALVKHTALVNTRNSFTC